MSALLQIVISSNHLLQSHHSLLPILVSLNASWQHWSRLNFDLQHSENHRCPVRLRERLTCSSESSDCSHPCLYIWMVKENGRAEGMVMSGRTGMECKRKKKVFQTRREDLIFLCVFLKLLNVLLHDYRPTTNAFKIFICNLLLLKCLELLQIWKVTNNQLS